MGNIIFDFDGTLVDSFEILSKTVLNNKEKLGVKDITADNLLQFRKLNLNETIKLLGIPFYKIPSFVLTIQKGLRDSIHMVNSVKDIENVLAELSLKGINMGVLTSNSKENVEMYLKKQKITAIKFAYSNSNLWGKGKSLEKIIKEQKLNPDETMYVGDEVRDIEAAKNAGVKSCAVTWGFQDKELLATVGPDFLIEKPRQLLDLLNVL